MTQEKQKILTNLYSIRAGLSVISELKDRADADRREIDGAHEQLVLAKKDAEEKEAMLQSTKQGWDSDQQYAEQRIQKAKGHLENAKNGLLKNQIPGWVFLGCGAMCALLALSWMSTPILGVLALVGAAILAIIGGLQLSSIPVKDAKDRVEKCKDELAEAERNKQKVRSNAYLQQVQSELNARRNEANDLQSRYDSVLLEKGGEISSLAERSELLYQALKTEFNDFLDYRDWDYIDLMIFHFETDRVDTLRESKLMVDTQRQNDRLLETLQQATLMICTNIRESISDLQDTMVSCFVSLQATLSSQLDHLGSRIGALGEDISSLRSDIRSAAAEMTSAQNMQNSLLSKSNVTSQKLAEDMRAMRKLADESNIRQRMNTK